MGISKYYFLILLLVPILVSISLPDDVFAGPADQVKKKVEEKAEEIKETVKEKEEEVKETVEEKAGDVKEEIKEKVKEEVQEEISEETGSEIDQETEQKIEQKTEQKIEEYSDSSTTQPPDSEKISEKISSVRETKKKVINGFKSASELYLKISSGGVFQHRLQVGPAGMFMVIGPSCLEYNEDLDITYVCEDMSLQIGRLYFKGESGATRFVFLKDTWTFNLSEDMSTFEGKGVVKNRDTGRKFTMILDGNNDKFDQQPDNVYFIKSKIGERLLDTYRTFQIGWLKPNN